MIGPTGLKLIGEDIRQVRDAQLPWRRLSGTAVVVTGASGFIGSYVVRLLLSLHAAGKVEAPIKVIAVVRNLEKAKRRFADLDAVDLRFVLCDLSSPQGLKLDAQWFIHAASLASPKHFGSDPVGTLAPNVIGTWHLLEQARASKAEGFLFVSSSEVYGHSVGRTSLGEDDYGSLDPTSVRSAYAESKRMGETLCIAWMHQFGVPVLIARPFHTYGPGVDLEDGRVFADFAADIVAGRDIRLNSDGKARRAFCYISDALDGLFRILLQGQPGRAYNVANPNGDLSVLELAELMVGLFPEKGLRVRQAPSPQAQGYLRSPHAQLHPSIERIAALGWRASVGPQAGFRRMVASYT
jgi:UDP-glucuronate decarboxylase